MIGSRLDSKKRRFRSGFVAAMTERTVSALIVFLSVLTGVRMWRKPPQSAAVPAATANVVRGDVLPNVLVRYEQADSARDLHAVIGNGCAILHFFLPDCPGCLKQAENWRGIDEIRSGAKPIPVTWIRVGGDRVAGRRFVEDHDLPTPSYRLVEAGDVHQLGFQIVPVTYVVDASKRMVKAFHTKEELEPDVISECESGLARQQ